MLHAATGQPKTCGRQEQQAAGSGPPGHRHLHLVCTHFAAPRPSYLQLIPQSVDQRVPHCCIMAMRHSSQDIH